MNQEPIKYEPDGKHKGWDLTGWWVRIKHHGIQGDALVKQRLILDGSPSWGIVNCDDFAMMAVSDCGITHLLGVEERRVTPQEAADIIKQPLRWNEWLGWWETPGAKPTNVIDWDLIEPYDPRTHPETVEPRPIYRPEEKKR